MTTGSSLESNPFVRKALSSNPFILQAHKYDAEIDEIERGPKFDFPDSPEGMLKLLEQLSDEELQEMFEAQQELERRLAEFGPQDDDELHAWIKSELGIDIPRTSVCKNHDPPFNFIADLYFERVDAVLAMGNRGGGKTLLVAILHWLNSLFKPGCESCTFGATEAQSLRCYAHLKTWIYDEDGERKPEIVSSLMRETLFINASRVEVLPGTPAAVNGPHPCHPGDEPVLTFNGYKRIDSLDPSSDLLASYFARNHLLTWGSITSKPHGKMPIAFPFELGKVPYDGNLIVIDSSDSLTRVTPNHIVRIKVNKNISSKWFVYLMRKGDWWRIGKTRGDRLVHRLNEERADDLWALKSFGTEVEALEEELIIQATYGITDLCFIAGHGNSRVNNPEQVHDRLAADSTPRANSLLIAHDMSMNTPLISRVAGGKGRKFFNSFWIDTAAGNILPLSECISVPIVTDDFEFGSQISQCPDQHLASVTTEKYSGYVYSLDIKPYHYYVAGGVVVHNSKAHADEVELMDDNTFKESRNMTMAKKLPDGRWIKAQDILTSTRKGPNGRMQKLIDEITFAVNAGYKPPRTLYQWCIKETCMQVKNCQCANPNLAPEDKCQCHLIRKGEWEDGSPRLLKDICDGDFHRSRGWQPFEDVIKQFTENDQETFEVQQLCLKPELRFHYLPKFLDEESRYTFRNYDADPENGPIYTSVDWGGTNPHAVNWYQYLQFEIEVDAASVFAAGPKRIRIPQGSIICFDELYKAEIGNTRLGQLVRAKEANYIRQWGSKWRIAERFADPQGKAARKDWKDMGMPTKWHVTREFEEHIKVITDLFDDNLLYVAADKCPMWVREAREWRRNPNTGLQIDTFNHCMSNFRYAVANIRAIHKRKVGSFESMPVVDPTERTAQVTVSVRKPPGGPLGFSSSNGDQFAQWRQSLGQPIRMPS